MITTRMFRLEMLRLKNGCRDSTKEQLDEVESKYPLNEHVDALVAFRPAFLEPLQDNVVPGEDRGVLRRIVNLILMLRREILWLLRAPMVTPTCMNDYGSLPALLCFPFVLYHIVLCFNCGVVHYIFANSICLCLLFCFWFCIQGQYR